MRVDHINIVVSNMERSLAFYIGLLGMQVTYEADLYGEWIEKVAGLTGVSARCVFCRPSGGGTHFELLEFRRPTGISLPEDSIANTLGLRHIALEVDNLELLYAQLQEGGIPSVSEPVLVPFSVAGRRKRLCYLRDPDGVLVEISEYSDESSPS